MKQGHWNLKGNFRGSLTITETLSGSVEPKIDNLNLKEMAEMAIHYLRGNPERSRNYECKFSIGPLGIPCHHPELVPPNEYGFDPVSLGDTDNRMDWQFANMREMTGEAYSDEMEQGIRKRVLSYMQSDNLSWVNPSAFSGEPVEGLWVSTWASALLLASLAETYLRTGEEALKRQTRLIFLALKDLAVWNGDKAYYPGGPCPYKEGRWFTEGWAASHVRNYPFIVEPCVRYWECTGDAEALDFARAMTEGFIAGLQENQGDYRIDNETGAFAGHVHIHMHAVWGVAHLGSVVGESRYLEWARRAYEFVHRAGTDYGWYPEFIPQPEYRAEVCVIGGMVSTGAWLARGGWPHYWDHVERTIRNELQRAQFRLTDDFLRLFHELHRDKPESLVEDALKELRRLEGGFVAQPGLNDWVSYFDQLGETGLYKNGVQMMGCCPPEGMRAIWEAWRSVVEQRSDGVYINMSFCRDHPIAKVTSYRPEDGMLVVEAKSQSDYFVRIPAWVDRNSVSLLLNNKPVTLRWGGASDAYIVCAEMKPGDKIVVKYSVPRFVQSFIPQSVVEHSEPLTVGWVGNQVETITPRGKYLPMF